MKPPTCPPECWRKKARNTFQPLSTEYGHGPSETDSYCAICDDEIEPTDLTNTHTVCHRTFHQRCLTKWMKARASLHASISCPVCNGEIARYEHQKVQKIFRAHNQTAEYLVELLKTSATIHFTPRAKIASLAESDDMVAPWCQEIIQTNEDDNIASHQVEAKSGSEVFQGANTIQAGLLQVNICMHECQWILLDPLFMYSCLSALYVNGWDPLTGELVKRLDAALARHQPLPEVINQAIHQEITHITPTTMRLIYPDYVPFQQGTLLHIQLSKNQHGTTTVHSAVASCMRARLQDGQYEIRQLSPVVAMQTIGDLGGPPDEVDISPSAYYLFQESQLAFMKLIEPFPN